ncbi:Na(+)/H(+) antiporter subunit D [Haloplanus halobius]|uniref:Na(+)/H(+) antiporter subunit D n=1 Tax=Haloplanus halobius TaxID=2934938 RepID=UPI00200D23D3|nr:Na(+)/H(+) antiporter subunit D [Haloplanus sp. XH21]
MAGPLTMIPPGIVVLAAALVAGLAGRRLGHLVGGATAALVTVWVWVVPAGTHLPGQLFGFDAVFFAVDPFSRIVGLVFAFIATVAVGYSWATGASSRQTAYALTYVGSSLGAVFAGDWLTMVVWWELMAVTSTILVWDYGGKAVRAGFRYAILHGIGGSLVLAAVAWHYVEVGSFLFTAASGMVGTVPQLLAAIGIGVNVGFIGLHAWLPDTYPRPHIAASVFLCVYTTKTGVYAMYRAFPEGHLWIAYMGGAMAVFGAAAALLQNDMRRLLSYHIQSQVGYMVAGVGIGSALAQAGAFGHVFNHILYKSLLFMTAGAIIYQTDEENLKYLGGLAREMPVTAIAFTIAALSIAGFPGFNGFVSKGIVISASHYTFVKGPLVVGDFYTLELLLLVGGVGTFLSFIKFGYYAFLHGPYEGAPVTSAPRTQQVAMLLVAALCVFYGVFDGALFSLLPFDVTDGTVVAHVYHTYTVGHVVEGIALAAAGVLGFVILKRPLSKVGRVPDVDAGYNPLAFYGTRALVHGVTETYAAVDRAAVALVERATALRADSAAFARLRANIGESIFVLIVVLAGVLTWLGIV